MRFVMPAHSTCTVQGCSLRFACAAAFTRGRPCQPQQLLASELKSPVSRVQNSGVNPQPTLCFSFSCSPPKKHNTPSLHLSSPDRNAVGEDVSLEPIAIELAAHPSCYDPRAPPLNKSTPLPTHGTVYSRSELYSSGQHNVWAVAKLIFRALDVGVHQLISHWLRCHGVIEPFLIAMRRSISTAHPVS